MTEATQDDTQFLVHQAIESTEGRKCQENRQYPHYHSTHATLFFWLDINIEHPAVLPGPSDPSEEEFVELMDRTFEIAPIQAVLVTRVEQIGKRYYHGTYVASQYGHVVCVAPVLPPSMEWLHGKLPYDPQKKLFVLDVEKHAHFKKRSPLSHLPWHKRPTRDVFMERLKRSGLEIGKILNFKQERGH